MTYIVLYWGHRDFVETFATIATIILTFATIVVPFATIAATIDMTFDTIVVWDLWPLAG